MCSPLKQPGCPLLNISKEVVGSVKHDVKGYSGEVLEGLIEKIDSLNQQKEEELKKAQQVLVSMDRLNENISRLEYQKRREKILSQKVAYIYNQLERTTGVNRNMEEVKSLGIMVGKFLNGVKVTGQIIEIVAGSMQVMLDTVSGVLKSQSSMTRGHTSAGEIRGLDLVSLLKPVNALLTSMVSKQPPSHSAGESLELEGTVPVPSKTNDNSVPVVKAVPVGNTTPQEK